MPESRLGHNLLLAMDRSMREYDSYGRMHVKMANISKANVCPYKGSEIPNWGALGLEADRVYKLLRCPKELAKAASTFNRIPLVIKHRAQVPGDHDKTIVVGALGSDANFQHPYLRNSMVIWVDEGLKAVESNRQRELSMGYGYTADMTPGVFEGEAYDGVMRDINGNHGALVKDGRAGGDVIVCDSKPEFLMKLTPKATFTRGILTAYLYPKLADNATLDLNPLLAGMAMDSKSWATDKQKLLTSVTAAATPILAQDATLSDLHEMLDMCDDEPGDPEETARDAMPPAMSEDGTNKINEFLKGKLDAADYKTCMDMMPKAMTKDALPPALAEKDKEEKEKQAKDCELADKEKQAKDANMINKQAMDSAIADAVKKAEDLTVKRMRDVQTAEREVAPFVGQLAMAMDSAENIYKMALDAAKVDTTDVHPSAFRAMVRMLPKPGTQVPAKRPMAMDAAADKSFTEKFPGADRLLNIA